MAASRFNFTKARVEALPNPQKRTYYRDTAERTLGLYVTPAGTKSFFATFTADGQTRRVPVGKHPVLSVPLARQKAAELAAQAIRTGVSPVEAKRQRKAAEITTREVLESYIGSRDLKPRSELSYRQSLEAAFHDYMDRPLAAITEKVVVECHKTRGERSKAQAELACRALGALFNYARAEYKRDDGESLFPANPVRILSDTRRHYRIPRRKRVVSEADLPLWWEAVHETRPVVRDYLVFLLLTGARREEARQLRWERTNFRSREFTLTDTKNRQDVTLPLPDYIGKLLKARRQPAGLVFPAAASGGKPLNVQFEVERLRKSSGLGFSAHDLRRTYITTGEGMDISAYTLKALVNHQTSGDVTAGYVIQTPERLRAASRRIEERLLWLADARGGEVINLPLAR